MLNETPCRTLLALVNHSLVSRSARLLGVLVMLTAWLAMSNHCGLFAMQHVSKTETPCCHTSSPGGPEEPVSSERVCCKSLRALPLELGTKLVDVHAAHEVFTTAWTLWADAALRPDSQSVAVASESPPRIRSFAEVVLQRSVLSNAPPTVG